jgi:hypothetical protein
VICDGEGEDAHEEGRQKGLLAAAPGSARSGLGKPGTHTHRKDPMNHVSINLEDASTGEIHMQVVHRDGFNAESPAHKLAIQIVKWLDEQATSKKDLANVPIV